jgi:Dehydratase medium subunit
LNVGIGVSEARRAVALHHRDLPASQPLFVLGATDLAPTPLRRLGANAARLVKGDPLAVGDHETTGSGDVARDLRPIEISPDLVERIATLAVARMVSEGRWRQQPSTNDAPRRRPA